MSLLDVTARPASFVELNTVIPNVVVELKYFTGDNFVGSRVNGYEREVCLITHPAAQALLRVQHELASFGLGLKVFDAYRPQRAVDHFIDWCREVGPCATQSRFFPDLAKEELFSKGYLVRYSSHSRGSTVDLTLIDLVSQTELEMGTEFDFFGPESWIDHQQIPRQARANRMLLQKLMMQQGFVPYHHEWWHFTLQGELYTDTYFDFLIA
ncbi:MAG: D-alanyl-D-alanine dipeptidase [Neptuniibacter pectenicola]|jgi:D-alanyl-D-alanine dipeptidase|uniref:M15 family metallopeptidase n=1 Tax=Neptuniibacter pectenicola TaxID=1806669 RepID=UPI003ADE0C1A|tara:strand:- start:926 stop:1558 length:633 start_codon:yes stop_codon:yes gene_type:complete